MNRRIVIIFMVVVVLVAGATLVAQQRRPYNQIMKDVGGTFASLRKNLESNNGAGAAEDAAKLQALFVETEAFWAPFDTQDAVNFAKRAHDAAASVSAAAKSNDIKAAQASVATIQKSCANCHFSHREESGKGFSIKP